MYGIFTLTPDTTGHANAEQEHERGPGLQRAIGFVFWGVGGWHVH